MATSRAATLGSLVADLRNELRMSPGPALGANARDSLVWSLQRTQKELYETYLWPFLRADEAKTATIGLARYSILTLDPGSIQRVFTRQANSEDWVPATAHSNPTEVLSFDDPTEPGDRALRWWTELDTDANVEQLVVWPTPTTAYQLLIRGQLPLRPFVNEGDFSTLDGTLLVMAAAVEFLADDKRASAQAKQARVREYLRKLLGKQGGGRRAGPLMIGGNRAPQPMQRRFLDYMP